MKQLKELIQQVSETASTKKKEELLKANEGNEVLFRLLYLHENPYEQFYIAKLPTVRPEGIGPTEFGKGKRLEKFYELTHLLKTRSISGHMALACVYDFFEACDEDEKWVFRTILLKEPLNFGTALINKVKPKWIPEFDLMLADAKQPKLSDVTYPIIAQHKLDGFRALYFSKQKLFLGRNGKPIRNENLSKVFSELGNRCGCDFVLDGELYSDTLTFNGIASTLNSENKPLDEIYYCVYDILSPEEWEAQECKQPYQSRWEILSKIVRQWDLPNVKVVPGIIAHDEKEVQEYYAKALSQGKEGLMLKALYGLYQWKRVRLKSQIMMKLKPSDEYDGKIVGSQEGEGQHAGMLGAVVVEVSGIRNPVKVGSGFAEEERKELWKDPQALVGQWIKLKAFEVTEGEESLRFPIFLSFRDSKD